MGENEAFGNLTTEQIVDKSRVYFMFILKYWYIIFIAAICGVGISYLHYSKIKPTYPGMLTYYVKIQDMVKESKIYIQSYSKLFTSQQFAKEILLSYTSKKELLINKYIDTYQELNPDNLSSDIPAGYRFETNIYDEFDEQGQLIFKRVLDQVLTPEDDFDDGYLSTSMEEDIGYITINFSAPSEELTLLTLKMIKDRVNGELTTTSSYAEELTYKEMRVRMDSIKYQYTEAFIGYNKIREKRDAMIAELKATYNDSTATLMEYRSSRINHLKNQAVAANIKYERFRIEYELIQQQHNESEMNMRSKLPYIKLIKETYPPIEVYAPSGIRAMLKYAFFFLLISFVLLLLIRMIYDIVRELMGYKQLEPG